jgi:hypothetical protein
LGSLDNGKKVSCSIKGEEFLDYKIFCNDFSFTEFVNQEMAGPRNTEFWVFRSVVTAQAAVECWYVVFWLEVGGS